jgi:hypothetical protein
MHIYGLHLRPLPWQSSAHHWALKLVQRRDQLTLLWYDTDRIENDASNNSSLFLVFVAAGTCIPSRCLTTIREYKNRHTDWWEGFIKYSVEMGSNAMIYIPSSIIIGWSIQKLKGGDSHADTHTGSKPTFNFQNKEKSPKRNVYEERSVC